MKRLYVVEIVIVAFIIGLFVGKSFNSEEGYYEDYYELAAEAWEDAQKADTPPVSSDEPKRLREVMALYRKVFEKYRDSRWADDAIFQIASRMDPTSEEAFALFRRLINNYPDSDWADDSLYVVAMGYYQIGQYFGSMDDSDNNTFEKSKRHYDMALLHFDELIEKYPGSELIDEAHLNKAMCHYGKGELNQALMKFANFQRDFPRSERTNSIRFYVGMISFDRREYADARTEFQMVVNSGDKEFAHQAQFNIGQAYFSEQKYDEAADAYQKTIENFAGSKSAEDANFYLGWAYQKQEKYDEAVEQLQTAIEKFPQNENAPNSQIFMAQIYTKMGKIDQAIEGYRKVAMSKDYDYDMRRSAQYYVAKLYESEKKDIQQAILEYEKLLMDFPELHIIPNHPSNDIDETFVEELKRKLER